MKAKCPKCKKPFDIKEHVCPNCGCTLTDAQYKFRRLSWRLLCGSLSVLAVVVLLVILMPAPEKTAQDAPKKEAVTAPQETSAAQSKPAEEQPVKNPFTKKVKNQTGREWAMTEVSPGNPWDSKYFSQKLGLPIPLDPEELNPKIVKMFYYPDADITLMVNLNKNEVMAWRDGKATK